ncbi:MAG: UDP-N-acetylmuramoyl-tripeptide--D-alanyl-D-alanine ligase [Candidatus Moranbacteria bacterium]|nr:UDP-N-acetylmuramoyl-tripeptide--D-alanyl-D-alanine ligase [Candidatus Moranbacteria bacterium]
MKSKKLILLEKILKYFAAKALARFKPRVVGITGSVGKTSTKEAVYAVLSAKYRVRRNEKNYNNEIGLPLTVLGLDGGGGSFSQWFLAILKAFSIAFFGSREKYPEILVLEMGADRPGDIKYLVDFLHPEAGVVTAVGISHLEFFKDKKSIAREKSQLVRTLGKNGVAILNWDDKEIRKMAEKVKARKISFGFSEDADVRASDIFFGYEKTADGMGGSMNKIRGVSFKLSYQGTTIPMRLLHSVGRPQISAVLAAAAVGIGFNMNLVQIAAAIRDFRSPAGRLNLIEGIKNTMIIEDSYNAAPQSMLAALEVLEKIDARRKIAVLGDMLELGEKTEEGHREVGRKAAEVADVLIAVGERARFIADEAGKTGLDNSKIICYHTPIEAKNPIQNMLQEGDVILVKGSRGMKMEIISKEVMLHPEEAKKWLPGQ